MHRSLDDRMGQPHAVVIRKIPVNVDFGVIKELGTSAIHILHLVLCTMEMYRILETNIARCAVESTFKGK